MVSSSDNAVALSRGSSFQKAEAPQKNMGNLPSDRSSTTTLSCAKKRSHEEVLVQEQQPFDQPPTIDLKKLRLPPPASIAEDDDEDSAGGDPAVEIEADALQLMQRLQRGSSILTVIAENGSINEVINIFEYLFWTCRVETFTLDLLLKFWRYFPEAASGVLRLFIPYGYWQQLLLLLERAKKKRHGNKIMAMTLDLMKEQWNKDCKAIQSHQHFQSSGDPESYEGPEISDLARWLPQEGSKLDKRLGFVQQFTWILFPKDKRALARSKYRKQVGIICEAARWAPNRPRVKHAVSSSVSNPSSSPDEVITSHPTSEQKIGRTSQHDTDVYSSTLLYLPFDDNSDNNDDGRYSEQESLTLPLIGRTDVHFLSRTSMRKACGDFLAQPTRHFTRLCKDRILYIHQGEVGHAVSRQCDIIVSDKATTCHVLAFRSQSLNNGPLTSLAHVDGTCYDDCIRAMVESHIVHHSDSMEVEEENKSEKPRHKIEMQIHMVGGFDDDRNNSADISAWLVDTLAWLADAYAEAIRMTIKTCAISSMNDNGKTSPIGRGMGIDLRTGEAFLAKVDPNVAGPAQQLRSARIWSGGDGMLNLVHTSMSNDFCIDPFSYHAFARLNEYLKLPDHKMIKKTSTSPDVEEVDFCFSVRNTLRFLREVDRTRVFGPNANISLIFQRVGTSNTWRRIRYD